MSVLAHVVLGGALQNEPAATQALAYMLRSSPDIARAFVGMLQEANIEFEPGRVEAEQEHEEARPDLTIHDGDGRVRVFVENKFWAGLTDAQPVSYLKDLPEDLPSALMFIVPEQRVPTVWSELRERCRQAGFEPEDAPGGTAVMRAHVGCHTMLIASWRYVLDRLLDAARAGGHDTIGHDILQLQGLAGRMDREAFLPLRGDELTDQEVARRLINYSDLIGEIIDKLEHVGVASKKGFGFSHGPCHSGRSFAVYGKFESWFGIDFRTWRDTGITPLWWDFSNKAGVTADRFKTNPKLFADVIHHPKGQYVPIRLATGVERDRVVDDAVTQMTRIADYLLETVPNG